MNNLNELNSLTETIKNVDSQIDKIDRNLIKMGIYKTYAKGIAIINDCCKFIGDNLSIFVNSPIVKKNISKWGDGQYWFVGGLTFIVGENGKVIRCWKMRKSSDPEQKYYEHETPYWVEWYSSDTNINYPDLSVCDNELISIKNDVDHFYSECEGLYDILADALTKTKEYKEKHLNKLNSAIDNVSTKKEVIYRIEITKETVE